MILASIGFYTMWFLPPLFIWSLVELFKKMKNEETYTVNMVICMITLWMILVPMFYVNFI